MKAKQRNMLYQHNFSNRKQKYEKGNNNLFQIVIRRPCFGIKYRQSPKWGSGGGEEGEMEGERKKLG